MQQDISFLFSTNSKQYLCSPSFLGTQSRPKVNFLIWITRWSGKEAKRVVLTDDTKDYINAQIITFSWVNCSLGNFQFLVLLGSSSLCLHSWAPEVCEDLWFAESCHTGREGDLCTHCWCWWVPLLTAALCFLKLFCRLIQKKIIKMLQKKCGK